MLAELAAALAAFVGVGRVAHPEPVGGALVFVQDPPGPVGH